MRFLLAASLIALVPGFGSTASPARRPPEPFPRAGEIVLACGGCAGTEIQSTGLFVLRPDGTDLHLVPGGTGMYEPRWSPDGTMLAASRNLERIWLLGADGSRPHPVTGSSTASAGIADRSPAWFPDGNRLVMVRETPPAPGQTGSNRTALWTIDLRGIPRRLLSGRPANAPDRSNVDAVDISHDGRRLVFGDVSEHLWIAGANGTGRRPLGGSGLRGRNPRWSPDDRRVAFESTVAWDAGSALRILDLRTGRVQTLLADSTDGAAWSPDGKWLAFARGTDYSCGDLSGCAALEVWTVNANDGRRRRVFRSPYGEFYGLDWAPRTSSSASG